MKILSDVFATARTVIKANSRSVGAGVRGIGKGVLFVGTTSMTVARFGNEYGTGGALAYSVATASMKAGAIGMGVQLLTEVIDKGQNIYRNNRKLEMSAPIQDNWGTIQTMRQESLHKMTRTRSAVLGRMLGNEASMLRNR